MGYEELTEYGIRIWQKGKVDVVVTTSVFKEIFVLSVELMMYAGALVTLESVETKMIDGAVMHPLGTTIIVVVAMIVEVGAGGGLKHRKRTKITLALPWMGLPGAVGKKPQVSNHNRNDVNNDDTFGRGMLSVGGPEHNTFEDFAANSAKFEQEMANLRKNAGMGVKNVGGYSRR